jgi:hypothetical protein
MGTISLGHDMLTERMHHMIDDVLAFFRRSAALVCHLSFAWNRCDGTAAYKNATKQSSAFMWLSRSRH